MLLRHKDNDAYRILYRLRETSRVVLNVSDKIEAFRKTTKVIDIVVSGPKGPDNYQISQKCLS